MAAKIIKGGDAAQPHRPAAAAGAVVLPRDVAVGEKKVLDKEIYAARTQSEQTIATANADAAARAERAEQEAAEARQQAYESASRSSRQEAVEAMLRAYCQRGDTLATSAKECLDVASTLVAKITGRPPTVPPSVSGEVIHNAIKVRRAKYPAVIHLPAADVEALRRHGNLVRALNERPEIILEPTSGASVLKVAGGEVPVDVEMVQQALHNVLGLTTDEPRTSSTGLPTESRKPDTLPKTEKAPPRLEDEVPVRRWTAGSSARERQPQKEERREVSQVVEVDDDSIEEATTLSPAVTDEELEAEPPPGRPGQASRSSTNRPRVDGARVDVSSTSGRFSSRAVSVMGAPSGRSVSSVRHMGSGDMDLDMDNEVMLPRRSVPAPVLTDEEDGAGRTRMDINPFASTSQAEQDEDPSGGTRVDVRNQPGKRTGR